MKDAKIKLTTNGPAAAFELRYGEPKSGESDHGKWWSFALRALDDNGGLSRGGVGVFFTSNPRGAEAIQAYGKGDRILLSERKGDKDRYSQLVVEPYTMEQQSEAGITDRDPEAWVDEFADNYLRAIRTAVRVYQKIKADPDSYGGPEAAAELGKKHFEALNNVDQLRSIATSFFIQGHMR